MGMASSASVQRFVTRDGKGLSVLTNHYKKFDLRFPGLSCVHSDPPIFEIESFLTDAVCETYIKNFKDEDNGITAGSMTVVKSLGSRTSTTRVVGFDSSATFVEAIQKLIGVENHSNFEEPQVVCYRPGELFTSHYDAIQPKFLDSSGQRMMTVICYLNSVAEGGETSFRDLELNITPKKGKALVFFPSFKDGLMDDRLIHSGLAPLLESKYIVQLWVRQNDYTAGMREQLMLKQRKLHS